MFKDTGGVNAVSVPDGVELLGLAFSSIFSSLLVPFAFQLSQLLLEALHYGLPLQLAPYVRLLMPLQGCA